MPLIRRGPPGSAGSDPRSSEAGPSDLLSDDPLVRRHAVRSLGAGPEAVPPLMEALRSEREPAVREAIFTALAALPDAAEPLASLLRSQDAGLRNGAIEALQALPDQARLLLPGLLADRDTDVRLLSAEIARCLPAEEATALLCGLLEREADANVCTTAVEILAEIGTPEAVPVLRRLPRRFPAAPVVGFAVDIAAKRIAGAQN